MIDFWKGLTRPARALLVGGLVLFLGAVVFFAWWAFRVEYQVLFTDLKPQDAQAMTAELDRQKMAYRLGENGSTILVDKNQVHATRIKLMGKEIPLQGVVGFELFNNTDFGMTEFAQKINYQRALQGELTRTILSLAEVSDVRVHLALPEQGLFKQASSKPKAAITLTLKQGQNLRPEQVFGIQHLVASATPGMTSADVAVVNHQGIALSRVAGNADAGAASGNNSSRLDLKKETEDYLARKAALVLDQSFGAGQALASVDVLLNMDQIRITTEEVIAAPGRDNKSPAGVVVRERESVRDAGVAPLDARPGTGANGSVQREVEYQVGRRVEQVVSQPGSIRRIQVVAVVRKALDAGDEEQTRKVVAAAVGASLERGDTVVVQSLKGGALPLAAVPDAAGESPRAVGASTAENDGTPAPVAAMAGLLLLGVAGLILFLLQRRNASNSSSSASLPSAAMTEEQRNSALRQVRAWMRQESPPAGLKP
jgi:flagellar M-ring protein FliF